MHINAFHLKRAQTQTWLVEDDASLSVVYGHGGGSTLEVAGRSTAACLPLRGAMEIRAAGQAWTAYAGDVLITDCAPGTELVGHANAKWLAVLGGRHAWSLVVPHHVEVPDAQLLPALHKVGHDIRRLGIAVVRAADAVRLEGEVNAFADSLSELQTGLREAIGRCPGRTWAAKRQVFLRLQRVCNYIDACCDRELDIEHLARMANYSPCHFLRTFRIAYLITPHAYVTDRRLEHALRLLRRGKLAVTEVAVASGFENRSAFSRLFHERFGTTAQEIRRLYSKPPVDADPSIGTHNRAIVATR